MLPENRHTFCIFIRQGQSPVTPIRQLPTDHTNLIRFNHTTFHHHHPILKNIMGKLVKSLDEIQIKIAIICQFHDSQFFWTTTLTDNIQIISTGAYARFCEIPRSTIKTPPLSMPLKKSQWRAGRWLEASNDRSSRIPGSSRAEARIRAWQLASKVVCATFKAAVQPVFEQSVFCPPKRRQHSRPCPLAPSLHSSQKVLPVFLT